MIFLTTCSTPVYIVNFRSLFSGFLKHCAKSLDSIWNCTRRVLVIALIIYFQLHTWLFEFLSHFITSQLRILSASLLPESKAPCTVPERSVSKYFFLSSPLVLTKEWRMGSLSSKKQSPNRLSQAGRGAGERPRKENQVVSKPVYWILPQTFWTENCNCPLLEGPCPSQWL